MSVAPPPRHSKSQPPPPSVPRPRNIPPLVRPTPSTADATTGAFSAPPATTSTSNEFFAEFAAATGHPRLPQRPPPPPPPRDYSPDKRPVVAVPPLPNSPPPNLPPWPPLPLAALANVRTSLPPSAKGSGSSASHRSGLSRTVSSAGLSRTVSSEKGRSSRRKLSRQSSSQSHTTRDVISPPGLSQRSMAQWNVVDSPSSTSPRTIPGDTKYSSCAPPQRLCLYNSNSTPSSPHKRGQSSRRIVPLISPNSPLSPQQEEQIADLGRDFLRSAFSSVPSRTSLSRSHSKDYEPTLSELSRAHSKDEITHSERASPAPSPTHRSNHASATPFPPQQQQQQQQSQSQSQPPPSSDHQQAPLRVHSGTNLLRKHSSSRGQALVRRHSSKGGGAKRATRNGTHGEGKMHSVLEANEPESSLEEGFMKAALVVLQGSERFNSLAATSGVVREEVWENQKHYEPQSRAERKDMWLMTNLQRGWAPLRGKEWTKQDMAQPCAKASISLPSDWTWLEPWSVDTSQTGADGWRYSHSVSSKKPQTNNSALDPSSSPSPSPSPSPSTRPGMGLLRLDKGALSGGSLQQLRRRRWVRTRLPVTLYGQVKRPVAHVTVATLSGQVLSAQLTSKKLNERTCNLGCSVQILEVERKVVYGEVQTPLNSKRTLKPQWSYGFEMALLPAPDPEAQELLVCRLTVFNTSALADIIHAHKTRTPIGTAQLLLSSLLQGKDTELTLPLQPVDDPHSKHEASLDKNPSPESSPAIERKDMNLDMSKEGGKDGGKEGSKEGKEHANDNKAITPVVSRRRRLSLDWGSTEVEPAPKTPSSADKKKEDKEIGTVTVKLCFKSVQYAEAESCSFVFGRDIRLLPSRSMPGYGAPLPAVLLNLHRALREVDGLSSEGIFRKAAEENQLQRIKRAINLAGGNLPSPPIFPLPPLPASPSSSSTSFPFALPSTSQNFPALAREERAAPDTLATLIKQFYRELPSPVLAKVSLADMAHVTAMKKTNPLEAPATSLLSALSGVDRAILNWLLDLANSVIDQSARNLMKAQAMAVVLGPNLKLIAEPGDLLTLNKYVEQLIQERAVERLTTRPGVEDEVLPRLGSGFVMMR